MGRLLTISSSESAVFILVLLVLVAFPPTAVDAVRSLRIVSPLQALTIWDPEALEEYDDGEKKAVAPGRDGEGDDGASRSKPPTHRSRFLPRFKAGLEAEAAARKAVGMKRKQRLQADAVGAASGSSGGSNKDWADQAASADSKLRESEAKAIEKAFDGGVEKFDEEMASKQRSKKKNENAYQFVGVVNRASSSGNEDAAITWYARKKPSGANWSVRLVHVNRRAIIKDLFNRGKVDIMAKYDNTGKVGGQDSGKANQPIVTGKYSVRERSWKNLWNFSPKHFFSDSSGMYWRERRLRPGLYTDGNTVYEASYRYRDGRNGMRRLSPFDRYLSSKAVDEKQKSKILRRLKEDTPDVVLED